MIRADQKGENSSGLSKSKGEGPTPLSSRRIAFQIGSPMLWLFIGEPFFQRTLKAALELPSSRVTE